MTWQNELQHILFSKTLIKRSLQGAALALVLITVFILGAVSASANIGNWVLIPIAAVTVAGAFGGAFYCFMDLLRAQGGWKKIFANVISVLAYFVILYLSLILALNAIGLWD